MHLNATFCFDKCKKHIYQVKQLSLSSSKMVNFFYYQALVSTSSGKQKCAMFFLLDRFIRENSGSNLILDFEGSMIPGVAKFYQGFGSRNTPYLRFLKTNIIYQSILHYRK